MRIQGFIVAVLAFFITNTSLSEESISLENLENQYLDLRQVYIKKGLNPLQILNVLAPRFIRYETWLEVRDKKSVFNIYEPAPITWETWLKGAHWIEKEAAQFPLKPLVLNLNKLKELHKMLMKGLVKNPGILRSDDASGLALKAEERVSSEEIAQIKKEKILEWHFTKCLSSKSPEYIQYFEKKGTLNPEDFPDVSQEDSFLNGKYCGYYDYPNHKKISRLLGLWIKDWNSSLIELPQWNFSHTLKKAAALQRSLVIIHPFFDGNGRLSRLLMDYLFLIKKMPPPILKNMDRDILLTPEDWAKDVEEGLQQTVSSLKKCLKDSSSIGCQPY